MKKIALFCCNCLVTAALQAQIIHVPADYPTIWQGIDAAIPGDTVLVADGLYYEQIDFEGKKPLMVASLFLIDGDKSHIANTIIDASYPFDPDFASVVYFDEGEDTTTVLCGFTIQNGRGTYTPDNLDDRQGGGIWISDAGAKIIHNRITHNTLDDRQPLNGMSVDGAGIGTKWADGNYWVVIANNIIDSNTCISQYDYAWGAGVSSSYNTRLTNNIITHNICSGQSGASAQGAGIAIGQEAAWTSPVVFIAANNTITHNYSYAQDNFATAAGVVSDDVQVVFSGNEVSDNAVTSGVANDGGVAGLYLFRAAPGSVVNDNVFKGNTSNVWSGGLHLDVDEILDNTVLVSNNYFINNKAQWGGAFSTLDVPVIMQNNVFSGNYAVYDGGAIYIWNYFGTTLDHLAVLINNTFSENRADYTGGAVFSDAGNPLIVNSILWQDTAWTGNEIYSYGANSTEVAYSNIDLDEITGEIIDGGGNINEDPAFLDLVLLNTEPWSPCVEAGIPSYTCSHGEQVFAPDHDILGVSRPVGGGYDMGAYELAYSGVGIPDIQAGLPFYIWPNPFSSTINFSYTLVEPSQVIIRVYDNFGRLVAELVNAFQEKGQQQIEWNAWNLLAGIYYYRLNAGNCAVTGKIIKM
jgi:hypothetical protein